MTVSREWLIGALRNLQYEAEEIQFGRGNCDEPTITTIARDLIAKAVAAGYLDKAYGAAATDPSDTLGRLSRMLCKEHPYPNIVTFYIARGLLKKAEANIEDADAGRTLNGAIQKGLWQYHAWAFGKLAEMIRGKTQGQEIPKPSRRRKTPVQRGPLKLTKQEKRAGELKAAGNSQKQIAGEMKVTGGRVSQLLARFTQKTGAMVRVDRTRQSVHAHKTPEGRDGEPLV